MFGASVEVRHGPQDRRSGAAAESESTERPPRFGVVEEVLDPKPSPASASAGMTDTRASTRRRQGRSGASPGRQRRHHLPQRDASPAPTPSRPGRGRAGGPAAVTVAAAETPPRRAHSVSGVAAPRRESQPHPCLPTRVGTGGALGEAAKHPLLEVSRNPRSVVSHVQDSRIRAPSRSRVTPASWQDCLKPDKQRFVTARRARASDRSERVGPRHIPLGLRQAERCRDRRRASAARSPGRRGGIPSPPRRS